MFSLLTTNQKGAIAEAAVALEAAKLGIGVYRPISDERYDYIFDLGPRLVRVQCKWASLRKDVVVIPMYSARRTANGLRRKLYSADEIDAFAAYSPDTERCYYAEIAEIGVKQALSLRITPTRNNQEKGIRWARDFEFGATMETLLGR